MRPQSIALLLPLWLWTGHCSAQRLRLAVVPEDDAGHAASPEQPREHDLSAIAAGLEQRGHAVTIIAQRLAEGVFAQAVSQQSVTETVSYDAILSQGKPAAAVADYAARLGIPVVRLIAEGGADAPDPFLEMPAVLVFASAAGEAAFGDMVEEAVRLIIPPSRVIEAGVSIEEVLRRLIDSPPRLPELEQKSLGLVMIVKDEAGSINATLASMRAELDFWTIVDTGSTDGTQDTVRAFMEGSPGQLLEEPFVDFSTTRNFALRAHGERTAYACMVDADYTVSDTWRLRMRAQRMQRECARRSLPACAKAMQIRLQSGTDLFFTTRVFPTEGMGTDQGWRYYYPVHEVPSHPGIAYMNRPDALDDTLRMPEVVMANLPITHNKSSARWRILDLPLLEAEHARNPSDARVAFYLAQTLDLLDNLPAALAMYQQRIDLGGWQQEVFEAHMRRGRIKHDRMAGWTGEADPRPDFLAAHALSPERAEPLIWMCWHHVKLMDACAPGPGQPACWLRERVAAFHYARRAAALDMPQEGLFLNKPVYEHQALEALAQHAWYIAKHLGPALELGHAAARKLLDRVPGPEHRVRNALLYEVLDRQLELERRLQAGEDAE